jgi:Flp pilus assembly protein TadD
MPNHRKAPRLALALRAFAVLALAGASAPLGGCNDFGDVTGSISGATAPPSDEAKLRAYAEECGRRYERNPGEKTASIEYARALRALTRYNEAVAVIQTAAIKSPKDFDVLGEYGKALADAGQLAQAKDVLSRAYTPDDPKWDVMSVQGSVADRLGDHASAMTFYRDALKIAPGEPSVLTNMGLSFALNKQLPEAEKALRQAVASPKADARMRGDLALVLALQGKFAEAKQVGRTDLSAQAAHANVEAIRLMIAQSDSWRELGKPATTAKPRKPNPSGEPGEGRDAQSS